MSELEEPGRPGRLRATIRDAKSAPWQRAAPLALVVIALICTGLVVADAGGWRHITPGGTTGWVTTYAPLSDDTMSFGGPLDAVLTEQASLYLLVDGVLYFVVLAGLLLAAALAGFRWLTVLLVAALGVVLAGWAGNESHLGYTSVIFRDVPSRSYYDGLIETSITLSGVVGLLLFFGLLIAIAWAVAGTRARRRSTREERAATRRPWRTSALIGVAAVATALVAPRAANELAHGANDFFGVATDSEFAEDGQQTMYLLFVAIAATYLGALVLPKRAPAAAAALVLVGAALWIPTVWMFGGMIPFDGIDGVIGQGATALLMWAAFVIGGFAVSAWIVARASRASRPRPIPA